MWTTPVSLTESAVVIMLRFVLVFASVLSLAYSADHDTFKDCSRVDFCSNLRSKAPENKYSVDPTSIVYDGANRKVLLQLTDGSDTLNVTLTVLVDNTFRIQIEESGSSRYHLEDVLDGEPQIIDQTYGVGSGDGYQTIVLDDYRAKVTFAPFSIEFSLNDTVLSVFRGDRLNFDESLDQAFTLGLSFPQASQLYGIHEHADSLALQTTKVNGTDPYRLRNLDVSGYELDSPMALYGSVPVIYAHGPDATTGIFLHNAAEQWVEVTNDDDPHVYIMVKSGALDLFVLPGPTPVQVVRQYVRLTGTAHLPQLWALGYHQSRWNYMSQDDLKDVVANFTTYSLPLDVIWLDIEYTDGKKYFTWNPDTFSDPIEMQQNISAAHKRLVTIIDPHIKVDDTYNVYTGALDDDLFVRTSDGNVFQGDCWPGLSSYMDFLNPEARDYYASFYSYENFPSTTPVLAGIWNDMNEPSVFDNSIEKTLPDDAVHRGGVLHRDIHNIYGLLHTKATHQGLIERDNATKRPFVLTRAHFAGTQRYSAIWTGDNTAQWGYLSVSYSECLDANLLGIVFCGADVGGFADNPTEELLQRWYQAGAWLPFYRAHSDINSQRREPFLFDEQVQEVIRNALKQRYQHLPVWYTLFYEHTRNRDPIIRPFFYHYSHDEDVYKLSDHLLVGRDILVRAVTEPGVESVQVYLPGGPDEHWISATDDTAHPGNGFVDVPVDIQGIPVFYRRGSVIVRKDTARLSSDEMSEDGHTLIITLDPREHATGTVYLDDNTSFNYVNNKEYNYLRIDVDNANITLTKIDDDANSDNFTFVIESIEINRIIIEPFHGTPIEYWTEKFDQDINGQLLKDFDMNFDTSITIVLDSDWE